MKSRESVTCTPRNAVESFYDSFLESRMVSYRLKGNLRLQMAKRLLLSVVRPTDTVADIGCGIGIVAEAVAKANPRSRVIGIDISGANIDYAKKTIHRSNIEFVQADVTAQFDRLHEFSPSGYDVIALVDVIEHIPESQRTKLFRDLERIAGSNALLVLTYPSPEYQRHLVVHNPGELQVIDNIIELEELCREAGQSGWTIQSFRKVDIWFRNQYVHCVLNRSTPDVSAAPDNKTTIARIISLMDAVFFRPFRAWYYRDRFLKKRSPES